MRPVHIVLCIMKYPPVDVCRGVVSFEGSLSVIEACMLHERAPCMSHACMHARIFLCGVNCKSSQCVTYATLIYHLDQVLCTVGHVDAAMRWLMH